ncbi:hypothetical protein [Microlunatus endophyticus]|uniref:hypothetical protein n=1 Tax=Microlunatus endophyticus TaxID=1716077 RepID=UPI00166D9042|nr:hypothetical protein [Microlunatus endophyticus]
MALLTVALPVGLLTGCRTTSGSAPGQSPGAGSPSPVSRSDTTASTPNTTSPSPGAHPSRTASPTATNLGRLLTGLVATADQGNRSDFLALVSDRDPGFTSTAGMIFDNLRTISPDDLAFTATGKRRDVSTKRARILGADAYAAQVQVTWSVPGDRVPSNQRIWMTIIREHSELRWAGVVDGPSTPQPTPLWVLEPVHYAHRGAATVITGDGIDPGGWVTAANTAISHDVPRLRGADWNHQLVIIVPSNEHLVEQSLGVEQGADSALAGISWPDGSDPKDAPIRIMINKSGAASSLSTAIVLAHETVHVATRSPTSPSPSWLVEGYADQIAYLAYPQAAQLAAADVLSDVKRNGPPSRLPTEADFTAGSHDLNRTYAQAWLACHYLAATYGESKLWRFYAAVDASRDGAIAGPARTVFGISSHQLVTGWQHYLQTAAKRGRI